MKKSPMKEVKGSPKKEVKEAGKKSTPKKGSPPKDETRYTWCFSCWNACVHDWMFNLFSLLPYNIQVFEEENKLLNLLMAYCTSGQWRLFEHFQGDLGDEFFNLQEKIFPWIFPLIFPWIPGILNYFTFRSLCEDNWLDVFSKGGHSYRFPSEGGIFSL